MAEFNIGGAAASGVTGMMIAGLNNLFASRMARDDRAENYKYNEMAAQNADQRTRALYGDFYSPQALMRQYKTAGLSPSMMFGGTPGQGGTNGAQGAGAGGLRTVFTPISMLEGAQAADLLASAELKKEQAKEYRGENKYGEAEINKLIAETGNQELLNDWQALTNNLLSMETALKGEYWEREYKAHVEGLEQSVINMREALNGMITENKIKKETANDVIEYVRNQVVEQQTNIMLKQTQEKLAKQQIELTEAQAKSLMATIILNWRHLNIESGKVKLDKQKLDAQVQQWAKENGFKNQEIAVKIADETRSWFDTLTDGTAKIIDAIIPF